jgi:GH15 family glucan-1,4-alpha-glucosidase
VLRRLTAVEGATRFDVALDVRAGYGTAAVEDLNCDKGIWTARSGPLRLRWSGAPSAKVDSQGVLHADIVVEAGGHHDLVLEIGDSSLETPLPDAEVAWSETFEAWRRSVPRFDGVLAARDVRQSYAVLRGMTSPGGGMVAAATLGLPERAEAGRNYDYRYAWVRDQCFAGHAVAVTGAHPLLDDAVRFVTERVLADGPSLRPAYCVDGAAVPDERELTMLVGYPGGAPQGGQLGQRPVPARRPR